MRGVYRCEHFTKIHRCIGLKGSKLTYRALTSPNFTSVNSQLDLTCDVISGYIVILNTSYKSLTDILCKMRYLT